MKILPFSVWIKNMDSAKKWNCVSDEPLYMYKNITFGTPSRWTRIILNIDEHFKPLEHQES